MGKDSDRHLMQIWIIGGFALSLCQRLTVDKERIAFIVSSSVRSSVRLAEKEMRSCCGAKIVNITILYYTRWIITVENKQRHCVGDFKLIVIPGNHDCFVLRPLIGNFIEFKYAHAALCLLTPGVRCWWVYLNEVVVYWNKWQEEVTLGKWTR